MIYYITAGETSIITLAVVIDPTYESLSFIDDFGVAGEFTSFDSKNGEIIIEPNAQVVGHFELVMILSSKSNDDVRTM